MTAVRRSSRTRQQPTTIYDEAKKQVEERDSFSERSERDDKDQDSDDELSKQDSDHENDSDVERVEEDESEEESSDEDDEKNFRPKPTSKARAAASAPTKKTKRASAPKKTQVKVGRQQQQGAAAPKSKANNTASTHQTSRRGLQNALAALGRKVLSKEETSENSLVAALLQSYKEVGGSNKKNKQRRSPSNTIYTAGLEAIARNVMQEYQQDPNKSQVRLLNLLFRSVGGSVKTNLDPDDKNLEDMNDEEWGKIVTDLVDEMRHTPPDCILICADPDGAQHAALVCARKNESETVEPPQSSLGVREYRKIYEEFWQVLGTVALTEGIVNDDDEDDTSKDEQQGNRRNTMSFTTTSRFEAEVVRDLILRFSELGPVGQPDIRAAATAATFCLGHAILERTVELGVKLDAATRQYEAATKGKKEGERSRKADSFRLQMDSIKRTRADLEEIVISSVIKGVFMHRYRDSDMFIRAESLKSLSKMTLQRPDLFLMNKYLKYFGWMASDKAACVRFASLAGLNAPFLALAESSNKCKSSLQVAPMQNVMDKFLPRIADCVIDVNLNVQEQAMSLLLSLLREGLFDDVEDDAVWNQINLMTLDDRATPRARRDALYFLTDQMEAFDEDEDADQKRKKSKGKSASLGQSSERMIVQRLDAIASWVAHQLVDGPIPIEKIRVQVADLVVHSLREMPEHKVLVTNWNAMLCAIGDDSVATTISGGKGGDRVEVAKQRVLVQMLACAAQAEVSAVAEPGFLSRDVDSDAIAQQEGSAQPAKSTMKKSVTKSYSGGMPHEVLSVALLSSLPDLLVKFKGDNAILSRLTMLPRYILPSVFSLSQRKAGFLELVKNLSDILLESSDVIVLQNTALSLVSLSRGNHTRAADAELHLRRVASSLCARLVDLLATADGDKKIDQTNESFSKTSRRSSKRKRSSKSSVSSSQSSTSTTGSKDDEVDSELRDTEYAIAVNLRRLRILSKRYNLTELLDDDVTDDELAGLAMDEVCDAIVDGMVKRLKLRCVTVDSMSDDEGPKVTIPDIWSASDDAVHDLVAKSVNESLSLLLSIVAWKLHLVEEDEGVLIQKDEDLTVEHEVESDAADKHGVIRLRKQLLTLLVLCFEQFLPDEATLEDGGDSKYSQAHIAFADLVQTHACRITGDVRALFLKEWATSTSALLRECALVDDSHLAGGLVRFLRSKEEKIQIDDDQDNVMLARDLLLPLVRSIAPNWKLGNRREAGIALAHVTGSGPEIGKVVTAMSRVLKRVDPVRLLEAHMASLRQSYEDWEDNEPEEPDNDRPSDEEMATFEEAEKRHREEFHLIEQQAISLSRSLGVGKLSNPKIAPSLLGFVSEGVKFAFSNNVGHGDEELLLGSRLNFLSILSKYATWIKRNKEQRAVLRADLDAREADLRAHADFEEVHEDELAALASFRKALGIKESKREATSPSSVAHNDVTDYSSDEEGTKSVSSGKRRRLSRSGSVSSMRSRMSSVQNSLSPLEEEDDTAMEESPVNEDEESLSSENRSPGQAKTYSQEPIEEGSSEED